MNKREELNHRLDAIIIAARTIVKRLKRLGMRQMITAQFTSIALSAENLKKRYDYLLTTMRRKLVELEERLEKAIEYVHDHYHITLQSLSPARPELSLDAPTKTVRVSITLQQHDWDVIDAYIDAGHVKSYAGYFRMLVSNFLED